MKQRIQTLEVENTRSRLEIEFLKDELKDLSIKLNFLEAQNKEALLLNTHHQVNKVHTDEGLFTNGMAIEKPVTSLNCDCSAYPKNSPSLDPPAQLANTGNGHTNHGEVNDSDISDEDPVILCPI
ncbi:hypothetical protein K7432_017683 [Basidiobolus ranarum]|uniref:Uncharacterized protein n=1 Tax=Basidiobolus ranarum TaxID=34480 RepID=A0ABR2WD40_9FUNG